MSLGSVWQSVDRHHTSLPLAIVNDWPLVPTLSVQSAEPLFVSRIDSCGFWPASYVSRSVIASTVRSRLTHGLALGVADPDGVAEGAASAVASGVGVALGVAVGVAAPGTGRSLAAPWVADDVGSGLEAGSAARKPRQGWAISSQTSPASTTSESSRTIRRRRYTDGDCRLRGGSPLMDPG